MPWPAQPRRRRLPKSGSGQANSNAFFGGGRSAAAAACRARRVRDVPGAGLLAEGFCSPKEARCEQLRLRVGALRAAGTSTRPEPETSGPAGSEGRGSASPPPAALPKGVGAPCRPAARAAARRAAVTRSRGGRYRPCGRCAAASPASGARGGPPPAAASAGGSPCPPARYSRECMSYPNACSHPLSHRYSPTPRNSAEQPSRMSGPVPPGLPQFG